MSVPGMMVRPVYRLYQIAWAGLDLLFPPLCGGCGKVGTRWCSECQLNTQVIPSSICKICGRVLEKLGICAICRKSQPSYYAARSWAVFDGQLRKAIHRLKYAGDMSLADILARPMLSLLGDQNWKIDIVVPVPISRTRRKTRGFNQAALLALPIALGSNYPFRSQALIKTRETHTQVGLSLQQRRANVAGAFRASKQYTQHKGVLVVDDVMTSGATMEMCARALLASGASNVYGLTLAQAGFHPT